MNTQNIQILEDDLTEVLSVGGAAYKRMGVRILE